MTENADSLHLFFLIQSRYSLKFLLYCASFSFEGKGRLALVQLVCLVSRCHFKIPFLLSFFFVLFNLSGAPKFCAGAPNLW